jgi:hypothetical protein
LVGESAADGVVEDLQSSSDALDAVHDAGGGGGVAVIESMHRTSMDSRQILDFVGNRSKYWVALGLSIHAVDDASVLGRQAVVAACVTRGDVLQTTTTKTTTITMVMMTKMVMMMKVAIKTLFEQQWNWE